MMENPVIYDLCTQTVTVYHRQNGEVTRQVVPGCFFSYENYLEGNVRGNRPGTRFLLIMPGDTQKVFPGDRIYDGVGPETVDWASFVPGLVPGLAEAAYANPWHWDGDICHVEAGRK